jgi:hypothetical protein
VAEAELVMADRRFRAHVAAPSMDRATQLLVLRLRRQIRGSAPRARAGRHEEVRREPLGRRDVEPWATRPEFQARPVDERLIIRRKTFALAALPPWEAAEQLEDLHHDFFLFAHAETGRDAVMRRDAEGWYELVQEAPVMDEREAAAHLHAGEDRHVVFTSPRTGRLCVLYRRYDGHYGLIEPPPRSDSASAMP